MAPKGNAGAPMPRYYFRFMTGNLVLRDLAGLMVANVPAAADVARRTLQTVNDERRRNGRSPMVIEIVDESDRVLALVGIDGE